MLHHVALHPLRLTMHILLYPSQDVCKAGHAKSKGRHGITRACIRIWSVILFGWSHDFRELLIMRITNRYIHIPYIDVLEIYIYIYINIYIYICLCVYMYPDISRSSRPWVSYVSWSIHDYDQRCWKCPSRGCFVALWPHAATEGGVAQRSAHDCQWARHLAMESMESWRFGVKDGQGGGPPMINPWHHWSSFWFSFRTVYPVGGLNTSEKYYIVNWDDYSQYMEKHVPNHQPDMIYPPVIKQGWLEHPHIEMMWRENHRTECWIFQHTTCLITYQKVLNPLYYPKDWIWTVHYII